MQLHWDREGGGRGGGSVVVVTGMTSDGTVGWQPRRGEESHG